MKRQQGSPTIRVAVAAPFPEIVRIHESTAEYADEIEVCAMISNADAVLDQARLLQPDVLLLSEELGHDRHDTLTRLGMLSPATRLVMLVGGGASASAVIADGVVALDAPPAELRAAIVTAMGRTTGEEAPPAHSRVQSAHAADPAALGSIGQRHIPPAAGSAEEQNLPAVAPTVPLRAGPVVPVAARADTQATPSPPGDQDDDQPPTRVSRTVLVFSGKGGVGKSVVATNLATALAAAGSKVALLDLDLQYGDVGVLLHLESHPVTIDTLAQREDIDATALDQALATSGEGVRVLLAPTSPEASDLVSAASVDAILALMSATHDYVVVDSPAHLDERIVGVMEASDQILMISSFGITSVKDAKVTLRLLQSLGVAPDRVALVINQAHPRISFPADEIERALHFPILAILPFEPRMDESLDSGQPLVVREPRSPFSRQLALLVDHVGRTTAPRSATKAAHHAARWRLRFGR
ncbi:MAG: P-loop NTPase [Candidatus Dormibacteraeota bacterium]|nr:P-loop NTPase [Candidatus Dormibacteraeota bacterium]